MPDLDWLPNLFIAGVPKAGTSSLHRWLADHPDAVGATDKEACFFVDEDSHVFDPERHVSAGWESYRSQFAIPDGTRPRVILDSTPSYIYQRTALAQIPDLPSRPRCVFVLRAPARQIRSVHSYYRDNWPVIPPDMSFADFIAALRRRQDEFGGNELVRDALENARYHARLLEWRARLGAQRMRVLTFEALVANPAGATRGIAAWMGLDPAFYDDYAFSTQNESYAPRSRSLHRLGQGLREHLPSGPAYRALRGVYRRLNARAPKQSGDEDVGVITRLAAEYADDNAALARDFDLDLSDW